MDDLVQCVYVCVCVYKCVCVCVWRGSLVKRCPNSLVSALMVKRFKLNHDTLMFNSSFSSMFMNIVYSSLKGCPPTQQHGPKG